MDEAQKPQYTVQFIDHAHARTRSIVLSRSALYVLIGSVGALILAALFAAGFALRAGTMLHVHEVEAAQLREVNRLQQEQILQVAKKASALQQELMRLRTAEDGLRNALGAKGTAADTIAVPYNDFDAIEQVMKAHGDEIAAIIVEPVAGNMGCVLPKQGYLDHLRKLTEEAGSLLIFDEVMCGFRASLGGAQAAYGIVPDLTCLGKIIGGGLPVAAYGGCREIMEQISPAGPVYQAGTLSGNPLAMTAGIETLKIITAEPENGGADYSRMLTLKTKKLILGWQQAAKDAGVTIQAHMAGSMFGIFFNEHEVWNFEDAAASDQEAFKIWFKTMLAEGIYLAPSQYETLFMSGAHADEDIERTIAAAEKAFAAVKKARG